MNSEETLLDMIRGWYNPDNTDASDYIADVRELGEEMEDVLSRLDED